MKTTRKYCIIYIVFAILYSFSVVPALFAETGYVSDMLILSLKEGAGRQYNTLRTLRSNTAVEILETTDKFLKVKTEEGDIGWVESQYITHEVPKTIIIEQLTEKIALLEGKNPASANGQKESSDNRPENQIDKKADDGKINMEYMERIKALEVALNTQIERNRALELQLKSNQKPPLTQDSLSKDSIHEDNIEEEFQKENVEVTEDKDPSIFSSNGNMVLPDDDVLKTAMIKWFCAGAAVLIAGWFIGRNFTGRRRRGLLD